MRKILSVLVALVLVLSFSLVTAVPALAQPYDVYVDDGWASQGDVDLYDDTLTWDYDAFDTITEGIAAIDISGTVHVLEGTYNEDIVLADGVDVLGDGAGSSIIDGVHSVVTANGVTSATVLDGFTITNGGSGVLNGGGMNNLNSSLTVSNCTFSGNSAADHGGGVYNSSSSPTFTNCTFSGNWISDPTDAMGGGMYNVNSSPVLNSCTFSGNSAPLGSGMYNLNSSPTLTGCTFDTNTALVYGGGMSNQDSSPTLNSCTFDTNDADYGGGMANLDSSPTLTGCIFDTNNADRGGGIYNEDSSSPVVTNCTFSGNTASAGGGMYNEDSSSSPVVTNCTFSGNTATGGGMCNLGSSPTLTNCIFWGDTPDEIFNMSSTPAVNYCDIEGGYPGITNIDLDPMFVGGGDYHLQFGSPCIDAGSNSAPSLPATDFEGDPRILDGNCDGNGVVDMGIDEFLITPSGGSNKDAYKPDEDVRVSADGYPPGVDVEVTVVLDNHWVGGEDIPQNPGDTIFAQATFTTDGSGRIDNQVIWYAPLEVGAYDIAFDAGPNGVYNVPVDMIDDPNDPGFTVSSPSVGGEVYPVDKAALLMPWLGLGLLLALAAGGLILARRRNHR